MNVPALLDELRSIAQIGLHYAKDPYDRERYTRLMRLAVTEYSAITGLAEDEISERFRQELGYVTPKVGCAAGVFNEQGQVLLVKRSDDGLWGLPAGFCEVNQSPRENLKREVREETGLEVDITALVDVCSVMPGEYGQPNTLYALVFLCKVTGGILTPSHETPAVGYFDHKTITDWHFDHGLRVERAYQYWLQQSE